jgi:hypothetical protein
VLWLRETAIRGDVRDLFPAKAQVVGSLLESHVLEHFTWADTRGGSEQAPKVAGAQTYQVGDGFQSYVSSYVCVHELDYLGNIVSAKSRIRLLRKLIERSVQEYQRLNCPRLDEQVRQFVASCDGSTLCR